jgi:GDP-D-mannose dehydratase
MIEIAYGVCDFLSPISEFVIESDDLKRENDYRTLFGNPVKIESELGWTPEHTFEEMVSRIQRAVLLKQSG